jgi:DNA-binding response OmpR family regulator
VKILVADDEKRFARILWDWLKLKGFAVEIAFDGQEALDLIKKGSYDLVFLDFKMPELTAIQIIKYAKQAGSQVKVIVVSGHPDMDDSLAKFSGADEFIRKPIRFELLEKVLKRFSIESVRTRNSLKFHS